ncbi:hypothetical protein BT67DRAFT_29072 [Trichocladium antarcticum]|uniref:Uncharacterized protein n=1 Tax=Trichocladium antarcticum TaxID=1450529 RepID=A0AAN6UTK6_9PEZI|nr:hypothetical protein BT67DRAFT_29072 [Trichocladium antarcticum]
MFGASASLGHVQIALYMICVCSKQSDDAIHDSLDHGQTIQGFRRHLCLKSEAHLDLTGVTRTKKGHSTVFRYEEQTTVRGVGNDLIFPLIQRKQTSAIVQHAETLDVCFFKQNIPRILSKQPRLRISTPNSFRSNGLLELKHPRRSHQPFNMAQ